MFLSTHLNHLKASLTKWLSVRLRTKWLWVRVPLQSLKRVQALISGKELRKLPDDSRNNFKKLNFDCYMERPSATLCNGK